MNTALRNACIDGRLTTLRFAGERIASLDAEPAAGDCVVDLRGDIVLPGLINAHDHLQLNNYPRVRFRERHANATEWIQDIDDRRRSDAVLLACARPTRAARLLQGGLKNLLSGVTTVAHHDPYYEELRATDFPVRVLSDYGWSHSLYVDGDSAVRAACDATAATRPWIIHAGEGVDPAARAEFDRLESLGCLRANTLLVHGVAFDRTQLARLGAAGAALVWCPASNEYLFGRTAEVAQLAGTGALLLGSDSRLSGSRDLLAEVAVAREQGGFDAAGLTTMVTRDAARALRLADRGVLRAGALADLLVLPAGAELGRTQRADVRAVFVGGVLRYGDAHFAAQVPGELRNVVVDGVARCLDAPLVERLREHAIDEPGLELGRAAGWRAA